MSEFEYQQLDEIIHSRIRLAVMAILMAVEDAEFTYLRDMTTATDGNLGAHLLKLEEAGYVAVEKRFVDRKPVTRYCLTDQGRRAFGKYVEQMERMLYPHKREEP